MALLNLIEDMPKIKAIAIEEWSKLGYVKHIELIQIRYKERGLAFSVEIIHDGESIVRVHEFGFTGGKWDLEEEAIRRAIKGAVR